MIDYKKRSHYAIDNGMMRFKDFLQLEDGNSSEKGLMGFQKQSSIRKPSDGQPFKNLGPVAGQEPRGNTGGGGAAPGGMGGTPAMFMKRMKKR